MTELLYLVGRGKAEGNQEGQTQQRGGCCFEQPLADRSQPQLARGWRCIGTIRPATWRARKDWIKMHQALIRPILLLHRT
jgi:hypothetical protein